MFNIFKGKPRRFLSEIQHKENLQTQVSMSPQTVEQLRGYGVDENKSLKLEYFFYTNDSGKAQDLSNKLGSMGYSSKYGASADDKNMFIVTGWSIPILMATESVVEWTALMCNLGFSHDCEFDGWGTNPEQ